MFRICLAPASRNRMGRRVIRPLSACFSRKTTDVGLSPSYSYANFAAGIIAGAMLGYSASLLGSNKSDVRGITSETPDKKVHCVALTGGPCGGKSTSLRAFSKELEERGYNVYRAPEVPTILISGGCAYPGIDGILSKHQPQSLHPGVIVSAGGEMLFAYESHLMDLQLQIEKSFKGIAESTGKPCVVVMDRGLLDIKAYIPEDKWNELLKRKNWTEEYLLGRYDMVLHLVTAANGAEKFYTKSNNAARTETPAEARALDDKLIKSWQNHKRHAIIDNSSDFQGKLDRATTAVIAMLDSQDSK